MTAERFDAQAFGLAVARRRERRGWTIYRLAQRARLADPYLRRVESGETKRMGLDVAARIAEALGVTLDDLLADAGLPIRSLVPGEMRDVYGDLGPIERRAWLRMGHTLRDIQAEYAALTEHKERRVAEEPEDGGEEELDDTTLPSPIEDVAASGGMTPEARRDRREREEKQREGER